MVVLLEGGVSGGHDLEGGGGGEVGGKVESENCGKGGEEWDMGPRQDMQGAQCRRINI